LDALEALCAAWRVTILAIALLLAAHLLSSIWNTGVYARSLLKSMSEDEVTPSL
jgi:hypothetical protein